jgi:magnesium transporter
VTLALKLKDAYLRQHPAAAARAMETVADTEVTAVLEGAGPEALTEMLERLTAGRAATVFVRLTQEQRVGVLGTASPRLAIVLLGGLDEAARRALLAELKPAIREDLERLQRFEEGTAGRLMDRPLNVVRDVLSVTEALEVVRNSAVQRARFVFVVDAENRLCGKVDMQTLALADRQQRISDIMVQPDGAVPFTAKREEIVSQLERFQLDSIPVIDLDGRLMGVVRYQGLFKAIENLATADLQTMVGASADERALSKPMFSVRKRLPWLHINLLTAFLAAAVVGLFESLIAQFTALAVLLPVVAGQSGNAGSQALAVTMRGLALREVGTREWRRVLLKEMKVGAVDGIVLAFTCGLGVFLWSQSLGLAVVIGVAMVLSMVAAGISGALVPMILTRLGQDPATASSIILTTVTDVAGFFSFLGTATLLSSIL